jgi:predicted porin
MKKAILILAALMLVASGVAAVSAYEAHVVNVRSHVENAIY